jgi:hypothetical protein
MARMNKTQLLEGTDIDPNACRFVENNTLERVLDDGTCIIRHFNTDIIIYKPDGTIVFNADGNRSMTTRKRMNEYQDKVELWQHQRVWYVRAMKEVEYGDNKQSFMSHDKEAEEFVYADGMTYHPKHGFKGVGKKPDKKMLKALRKYSKDFADKLPVDMPGQGDCWYCGMKEKGTNIPIGDVHKDTSHLISHIFDDRYYVPSLLMNALDEAQRGDFIKACAFKATRQSVLPLGEHQGNYYASLLKSYHNQMAKDIYTYLYKRIIDKQFPGSA